MAGRITIIAHNVFSHRCFMSSHYQVYVQFSVSSGKPSLIGVSLHSTSQYFPFLVFSPTSSPSYSRYFQTVPEAQAYISYLFTRYPQSTAPPPKLDALQLLLF